MNSPSIPVTVTGCGMMEICRGAAGIPVRTNAPSMAESRKDTKKEASASSVSNRRVSLWKGHS
jgi:hypothetical protein